MVVPRPVIKRALFFLVMDVKVFVPAVRHHQRLAVRVVVHASICVIEKERCRLRNFAINGGVGKELAWILFGPCRLDSHLLLLKWKELRSTFRDV
jgi:hypothetical protein